VWRLNVAHTLFMQENKFWEATSFYEPLVKQNYDNVRLAWFWNLAFLLFTASFVSCEDFGRQCGGACKSVRLLLGYVPKWGSWRTIEKTGERRGAEKSFQSF
jgi:hypothetical protein